MLAKRHQKDAIAGLPQVKNVSPSVSGRGQIVYGHKNWNTQIQGTGADYATMRASVPQLGRFFTQEELRMRQKVALLGATVAQELFSVTGFSKAGSQESRPPTGTTVISTGMDV